MRLFGDKSDEDLVRRILKKNRHDDFGILYDRHVGKVYGKCLSFVKNKDEAQDLTHDIFLKTYLNLSKFNFESKFTTWLYSLTYNFCVDYLRKEKKMQRESDDKLERLSDVDDEKTERELLKIKSDRLMNVLDLISPEDKMLLLMKYQDEYSIKDICEALSLGESAIKMRLQRARSKAVELYNQKFKDDE